MNLLNISAWPKGEESVSSTVVFPLYYFWFVLIIPVVVLGVWLIRRNKKKGQS